MSRQVFDGAVTWAMKADKTHFWKSQSTKSKTISKPETAKEGLVAAARKTGGPRASVSRTEEYVSVFSYELIISKSQFLVLGMRPILQSSSSLE